MDSGEVLSSIESIYDRFQVIDVLRLHMYRVAAVAGMICDDWSGPTISKSDIIATCLLHDIGNIVKFDLTKEKFKVYTGRTEDLGHWQGVRKKMVERYGTDDHAVTNKMLEELGVSERLLFLTSAMGDIFGDANYERVVGDYGLVICSYADFRAGPHGILGLRERYTDLYDRYTASPMPNIRSRAPLIMANLERGLNIERLIFANERIRPTDINDKSIKPYLDKYMQGKFD